MSSIRVSEYVLLWSKGDVVGMAKLLFEPGTSRPSSSLHGRELQRYAKKGEVMVGIHNVMIFVEFEESPYLYWFDGIEKPPQLLGELNRAYFRGIVAWDLNQTVRNPKPSLGILGEHPRPKSNVVIDTFRDLTGRGLRRVSFGAVKVREFTPERIPGPQVQGSHVPSVGGAAGFEAESRIVSVSENCPQQLRNDLGNREGSASGQSSPWADWQCSSYRLRMKLKAMSARRSAVLGKKRPRDCNEEDTLEGEQGTAHGRSVHRRIDFGVTDTPSSELPGPSTVSAVVGFGSSTSRAAVVDRDVFASGENMIDGQLAALDRSADTSNSVTGSRSLNRAQLGLNDLKIKKKRKYTYKSRRRAGPKKLSAFRRKCLELREKALRSNPFLQPRDCCKSYCFDKVNPEYARSQYVQFLVMERAERKRALSVMLDKTVQKFRFDGLVVCSRFVSTGLSFSFTLQTSVKDTPLACSSSSIAACPREVRRDTVKDSIILFLRSLAATSGDYMPNRSHVNLPSMTRTQVFEKLLEELRTRQSTNIPSRSYFFEVWREFCSEIKTHRYHGFSVCDECDDFRSQMELYSGNEEAQAAIRENKKDHFKQMKEERLGYAARRDLAVKYPSKYCSLIVDGADQRNYGLPHFIFNTKAGKGHKLKVKIVGVLEHGMEKSLSLFTMTEEFETGANHVIEAVHRVLQEKKERMGRLPERLFVQADNCTRENKNRYLLSYFEMLVARGVFVEVQISFLPIGHTHADVDQCFSVVARRLRMVDTVTMNELMTELGNCYTPPAKVSQISAVANFSGLCKEENCLNNVPPFSYYRYFRFTRHSTSLAAEACGPGSSSSSFRWFKTTCDVKYQQHEEWCPSDNTASRKGFLRHAPDLSNTPPIETRPPTNVQEINACFRSYESKINSTEKLQELKDLRDVVYTRRVITMPWNVATIFETKGEYLHGPPDEAEEIVPQAMDPVNTAQVPYTLNYFVAVVTDDDVPEPFWIARILRVESTDDLGNVSMLKIRWYQAKLGSKSPYSARYEISTYVSREDQKVRVYDDSLDVRTIICEFESLNRLGGLHVRTQKAIRQALNQN